MFAAVDWGRVGRRGLWAALCVGVWFAASIPSGFHLLQIAMFIGPGIVLALAASWASHAAFPNRWNWYRGRHAALVGAVVFPPFVALFFAWAGTFGSTTLVALLVFSAWLAVLGGLMVTLVRLALTSKTRQRAHATRAPTNVRLRMVR